jgi:hypothetical protein
LQLFCDLQFACVSCSYVRLCTSASIVGTYFEILNVEFGISEFANSD